MNSRWFVEADYVGGGFALMGQVVAAEQIGFAVQCGQRGSAIVFTCNALVY